MRIGIVSDTHNNLKNVVRIVELFNAVGVARVIHTGDITQAKTLDVFARLEAPLTGVFGNNDQERDTLEAAIDRHGFDFRDPPYELHWHDRRIIVVHDPLEFDGHLHGGHDLALHGHTHLHRHEWQDGQHGLPTSANVLDSGHTLKLSGNAWKMIERPYTVSKRTVVSFDFRSTSAGQIHGFGLDNDDVFNREVDPQMMQVFGDETLPRINRTFWNYSGAGENAEWKHYVIPVGQLHQGEYRYLYFVADDDVSGKADSYFRNVRIYEAQSISAIPGAVTPLSVTIGKGTPW